MPRNPALLDVHVHPGDSLNSLKLWRLRVDTLQFAKIENCANQLKSLDRPDRVSVVTILSQILSASKVEFLPDPGNVYFRWDGDWKHWEHLHQNERERVAPTENQSAQLETPDGFGEQMYVWLMFSRFSRGDDSDDIPLWGYLTIWWRGPLFVIPGRSLTSHRGVINYTIKALI